MTDDHRRPAGAVHAERVTVIACGQVAALGAAVATPPPACYQALDAWGQPDAGMSWFSIGGAPDAEAPPVSGPTLAEILGGTQWLLLVVGPGHDSLALALALASWARARGIRSAALRSRFTGAPALESRALEERVQYACACPPGLDALAAARVLALGVAALGGAGDGSPLDRLVGGGRLHWIGHDAGADATPPVDAVLAVHVPLPAGAEPTRVHGDTRLLLLPTPPGLTPGTYLFCT